MSHRVEYVEIGPPYDMGTKLWSTFFGLVVAGLINWFAVIVPARDHSSSGLHMSGWYFALIVALLAPVSWLVGRVTKQDWAEAVIWIVASALALVFQLVVLSWANSY